MYLLDTDVLSELRRPRPHGAVKAWLAQLPLRSTFVAAPSIGEMQAGVERTRRQDAEKARSIDSWIDQVVRDYPVIAMDADSFRVWARLMHRRSDTLLDDAMIAATAIVHRLTVATRNVRGFRALGVPVVDPFAFNG